MGKREKSIFKSLEIKKIMKLEDFYHKYANTPIEIRFQVLDWNGFGSMTLYQLFKEVENINERTRADKERQQKLIDAAEGFWQKV